VVESSPTVQLRRMLTSSKEKVVIVVLSVQPKPTGSTLVDDSAFLAAVVKALDEFRR
jgi:galactokinase/mevalonate kinase-like predicted kinase